MHKKIAIKNVFEILENQDEEIFEKQRMDNSPYKPMDGSSDQNH